MHRFIVDAMLGKLARWLRVLGWDTVYERNKSIEELCDDTESEDRIILTRRQDVVSERVIIIESEKLEDQLRQLEVSHQVLTDTRPFTRCVECNCQLKRVMKTHVEGLVPFYTYSTQQTFWRCPACGKIFWPGTHHQAMLKKVKDLKRDLV